MTKREVEMLIKTFSEKKRENNRLGRGNANLGLDQAIVIVNNLNKSTETEDVADEESAE